VLKETGESHFLYIGFMLKGFAYMTMLVKVRGAAQKNNKKVLTVPSNINYNKGLGL